MKLFGKGKQRTIYVAGGLIALSFIALIISIVFAKSLQNRIAVNQLEMLTQRTESENNAFNAGLNTSLTTISGLVKTGGFTDADYIQWSSALGTILQSNLNITAISIVNSSGGEYYASLNDSVLSYYFIKDKEQNATSLYARDLSAESISETDTTVATKAVNLDSYKNQLSVKPDSVVWHILQPIPGFKKKIGNAASVRTIEKNNGNEIIISIYTSLETIYYFVKNNAESVNADIFFFTEDQRFLDLSNNLDSDAIENFSDYLTNWTNIESGLFKQAISIWVKTKEGDSIQYHSFKYDNHKYWGAFRPIQQKIHSTWVALIVPEDDFIKILGGNLGILFFASIVVLLFSALVLIIFLRKNLFEKKNKSFYETEEILEIIKKGEDEHTEFKSTIRMNLYSKKPGKEIELAWLKSVVAFCNSNGGTILIGINDDGEILGLENDLFPNDDKCLLHVQNLLKDHIGMEFTKYINYRLHSYSNKKFLAVYCTPAQQPLFLISNNKEQFYVRSGPASIELPLSKALKYIKDRNKN